MAISYQFTADGYYIGATEDYGFPPNNSTHKKPAEKEGYIPRWTGKSWTQVENHKGEEGYVNEQHFKMEKYGPLPEGFTKELDTSPKTPEEAAKRRIDDINSETSQAITAGFDYYVSGQKLHFSYDSYDQQNFADAANACMLAKSNAPAVSWNGYKSDGTLVSMTLSAENFLELYTKGALAHKNKCIAEGSEKKAAIRDAVAAGKTAAEIMAL